MDDVKATNQWLTPALYALAAAMLGAAIQLHGFNNIGDYLRAFACLGAAIVACLAALLQPRFRTLGENPLVAAHAILCISILWQFGQLASVLPVLFLNEAGFAKLPLFLKDMAMAAVCAGVAVAAAPLRISRAAFLVGAALFLIAGILLIRGTPHPAIDVYDFQVDAPRVLAAGDNPYAMTFPNIYGENTPFYPKELVANGRLQVGYPYPPLTLLWAMPGTLLMGDFRYLHMLAILAAALLIAYSRPTHLAIAAALVFLFTPRVFFIIEQGWTESLSVLLVAATVWAARHRPGWVPIFAGCMIATKQYFAVLLPLFVLLLPQPWTAKKTTAYFLKLLIIPVASILPFCLWNFGAFYHSVIEFHLLQPFRPEALSFAGLAYSFGGMKVPSALCFVLLLPLYWIAWKFAPRNAMGFCGSMALTSLVFFATAKQAWANYYFFVLALLCLAAAN